MKSNSAIKIFPVFTVLAVAASSTSAQRVEIDPFDIAPPTVFSDIRQVSKSNPQLTASSLVEEANKLLEKKGLGFIFSLDDTTCVAIDKAIKTTKDRGATLALRTKLRSVGAEPAVLRLPPADFRRSQCSMCSVTLPLFEVTEFDFVALMLGTNIKFHKPTNFVASEAYLVDEKDLSSIKTTWRIPYRADPIGISYDGNVLYLPLPDPDLKDISVAVFSEGVFQFATRSEAEASGKPNLILDFPKVPANPTLAYVRFDYRQVRQVIKFSKICDS